MIGLLALGIIIKLFIFGQKPQIFFAKFNRMLQFIVYFPFMNVVIPSNVLLFNAMLIQAVNFDLFYLAKPFEQLGFLKFDVDGATEAQIKYSQQVRNLGYKQSNILKNSSTICMFLIYYFLKSLYILLCTLIGYFCKIKRIKNHAKQLVKTAFLGELLSLGLEAYLELLFAGYIGLDARLFTLSADLLGSILSAFCLFLTMIFMPIVLTMITLLRKKKLLSKRFKKIFGELYEGIKAYHWTSRAFNLLFIMKRIIFFISVTQTDETILQIILLMYLNLGSLIYLGLAEPATDRNERRIDLLNEMTVIFAHFHVLVFSDWQQDPNVKYMAGWSYLAFVQGSSFINLCIVSYYGFHQMKLSFRKNIPKIFSFFRFVHYRFIKFITKDVNQIQLENKENIQTFSSSENNKKQRRKVLQGMRVSEKTQLQLQNPVNALQVPLHYFETELIIRTNKNKQKSNLEENQIQEKDQVDRYFENLNIKNTQLREQQKKAYETIRAAAIDMEEQRIQKMRESQERRRKEKNDHYKKFIKKFQSFGDKVVKQKRTLPLNYVKVLTPREKQGRQLFMSPVTPIGGVYFVPTQEIIDEMSSDDENEIRQICLQQRQITISKKDEPWNPLSHPEFIPEDLYDDRIIFFNNNVFCQDTENEHHYVKFHKQPTARFPNQNFPGFPYNVDLGYLNTCMKAYRACLYYYKLQIIVKQIEECLLQGKTYIPHYDQCKMRNYRETEISESTVKDILITEAKKYLIIPETPSLYSLKDLLVPRGQVLEIMTQKIACDSQRDEQEMINNELKKLAKREGGSTINYNQEGELTFRNY